MARPKSQTLFHFTRKLDYLKGILKDGFHPRYCVEDLSWLEERGSLAYPMVCFCDIPLGRVEQHNKIYGSYGIGMSRAWAIRNKLNPVIYLSKESALTNSVSTMFQLLDSAELPKNGLFESTMEILRYIKPLTGQMKINGKLVENVDFYQESEWRFIPKHDAIRFAFKVDVLEHDGVAEEINNETFKHGLLKFNADDVRYLFVEKDSEIPELVDFMRSSASGFSRRILEEDMKILQTRIVSQESLAQDL